jgi:hypothetical protein
MFVGFEVWVVSTAKPGQVNAICPAHECFRLVNGWRDRTEDAIGTKAVNGSGCEVDVDVFLKLLAATVLVCRG